MQVNGQPQSDDPIGASPQLKSSSDPSAGANTITYWYLDLQFGQRHWLSSCTQAASHIPCLPF